MDKACKYCKYWVKYHDNIKHNISKIQEDYKKNDLDNYGECRRVMLGSYSLSIAPKVSCQPFPCLDEDQWCFFFERRNDN